MAKRFNKLAARVEALEKTIAGFFIGKKSTKKAKRKKAKRAARKAKAHRAKRATIKNAKRATVRTATISDAASGVRAPTSPFRRHRSGR